MLPITAVEEVGATISGRRELRGKIVEVEGKVAGLGGGTGCALAARRTSC